MSLTVHLDLNLKSESLDTASDMIRDILAGTQAFDGCLGVEVLVDHHDPAHMLVVERWASLEQDAAYREWRAGDGATELGSLLAAAPTLTYFVTSAES
ncbi:MULTISPECIES: putative quinol monooxygenase [Arthrobacter]|uniref:Antibiotic biosynthesis monooxygenase n=1 Tax=Arthrobacter oryzae TaxID=409290 RepID=A0A3N0BVX7_9MICC|nr:MULTISPECIES: antibiotic biosynthesis monooxygenase [Arthrobacter]QYF89992.1 antibiotic biosynthesis monooxygenase [Arthrobacter sp. PAMC25284]RNL53850.1 antibiotic biosynthesis monooxygenase [Arthrobacter oryzae]